MSGRHLLRGFELKTLSFVIIVLLGTCSMFGLTLGITASEGSVQLSGRTVSGLRVESVSSGSLGSRFLQVGDWILSVSSFWAYPMASQQSASGGANYQIQTESYSLSQGLETISASGKCDGAAVKEALSSKSASAVLYFLVYRGGRLTLVSIQ